MDVSVVCPFYNESAILEYAIRQMLGHLEGMRETAELIVVNDGSTDGSEEIALRLAAEHPNLRVVGYPHNRGRGRALRTGIELARGRVIVTTEIDLSWGDTIVADLLDAMRKWPDTDIVVASPHLPGGTYRNVPFKRVLLSKLGNRVIRTCISGAVTMNTGMTRAYRRESIRTLPLSEDGKEFHLEVILKANALGMHIREIPAVLEWKHARRSNSPGRRKDSSRLSRMIVSHTLFSLFANPVRYVWGLSLLSMGLGFVFFLLAVLFYYLGQVSIYAALLAISLVILGIMLFVLGVVLKQGNMIQRELWMLQRYQLGAKQDLSRGEEPEGSALRDPAVKSEKY